MAAGPGRERSITRPPNDDIRIIGALGCVLGHILAEARTLQLSCGIYAGEERQTMIAARTGVAFQSAWPLAGIGLAVAVSGVW
jgi:hypothetical protein